MAICDRLLDFMEGLGTIFQLMPPPRELSDFFPYYKGCSTPEEMDAAALRHDFEVLGKDFEYAIGKAKEIYKI